MRLVPWLPPALWMGVIVWLSTDTASAAQTGDLLLPVLRWLLPWATPGQLDAIHGLLRKGAHLTEYAILAALWSCAFTRGSTLGPRAAGWLALAISVTWAVVDEWHQSFLPSRTGSAADVAIDSAGAALALVVAHRGWRPVVDGVTPILLWLGAAGGATLIAINAWAGVPSGGLWITTPAAGLMLLGLRRLRRRKATAPGGRDGSGRGALRDP